MADLSDLGALTSAIRPISLHEEVASRLRAMIFERRLAPGQWVDEQALARDWAISRTPVREALKVLVSEGLVTLTPRRGCMVTEISEDDAERLFPVMALLEGRCAFEAAQHASDAELTELARLHDELERHAAAGDADGYYRANHVFHSRVQAVAANPWLSRSTDQLRVFMRLLRGRQLRRPGRMAASIVEHRELIDALTTRDARRAERVMNDHLMAQLAALQALRAKEREAAAGGTGVDGANRRAPRRPRKTERAA
jgi:DNA-binding GntR family transcriptional regulator